MSLLFPFFKFITIISASFVAIQVPVESFSSSEVSNAPKIVDPVERLNHPEGTNATFTCSIGSGDLSGLIYEWRKDDIILSPVGNQRKLRIMTMPENYQSVLRVIDLKPTDSGVYSCLAKNRFGQDKVSTKLTVKVQLKWIVEPQDSQVPVGKSLYIPCQADGSPKPVIEWSRLSSSNNYNKEPDKSQLNNDNESFKFSELRFVSVNQNDSGIYECRARNGQEKDLVRRIKVNVLGK